MRQVETGQKSSCATARLIRCDPQSESSVLQEEGDKDVEHRLVDERKASTESGHSRRQT